MIITSVTNARVRHVLGLIERRSMRNKHKQLIWWTPKCCFKYDELQDDFWKAYELKKDQFISDVASGKYDVSQNTKDADRFSKAIYELKKLGRSPNEIADMFGVHQATVYRRLADHNSSN